MVRHDGAGIGGYRPVYNTVLPQGHLVAARRGPASHWAVCKVVQPCPETGSYLVEDVMPDGEQRFFTAHGSVRTCGDKSVRFSAGDRVLAIWPESNVFYPAEVLGCAENVDDPQDEAYKVLFDADEGEEVEPMLIRRACVLSIK